VNLQRIIREPLVHFFVLGAALFGLFVWLHEGALDAPDEIVVDGMRVDALRMQYERLWQRPPTETELKGLVDNWVREEVLYREGLALGLDRNDPVLRRRIAQKMSILVDDASYESLRERYAVRYDDDVAFAAGGQAQGAAP